MKNLLLTAFVFMTFLLLGCEVIGDIFKAGVWVGILAVVGVIVLVVYLVSKLSGKK